MDATKFRNFASKVFEALRELNGKVQMTTSRLPPPSGLVAYFFVPQMKPDGSDLAIVSIYNGKEEKVVWGESFGSAKIHSVDIQKNVNAVRDAIEIPLVAINPKYQMLPRPTGEVATPQPPKETPKVVDHKFLTKVKKIVENLNAEVRGLPQNLRPGYFDIVKTNQYPINVVCKKDGAHDFATISQTGDVTFPLPISRLMGNVTRLPNRTTQKCTANLAINLMLAIAKIT